MAPSVANEIKTYALIICVLPRCARGEVIKYDMNMMNLLFFVSNLCPTVRVLNKNMLNFLYSVAAGFLVRQLKGNLLKDTSCVRNTGTTSKNN